ncbi:group 1 glycosyl transferase [Clostridium sartagoforme AAU1]|uniref:Group 1 glycosyl transferase n=1 Tax=Clostridium sartagoforme AAU1 TaxID=1202534 RepID=R9C5H0_9CLOT|nr:glycosyltransferase family 4 protein [Clostridium sartagoforme]EOR24552.1 group 1 glycosyl transferase [Clostridium sartagoforme AAU1]
MKIIYACEWNKNKETTWSGTTYSLLSSIKNKVRVEELDLSPSLPIKILNKILGLRIRNGNISFVNTLNTFNRYFFQKKINNALLNNNKDVVLQIGDYGKCKNQSYIYQDLSVDSLVYFRENFPELFKYSGYENISYKQLNKRLEQQIEIYNNCQGILTMSKWLSNNLVEYTGIPKEKVHWVGAGINLDKNKINNCEKDNRRILFVGRDFKRKGGDLTYNAFKILKDKYIKDAELYVAGPTDWPLDEKIDGVTFLGDLSYAELSNYFNLCDIFCLPSRFEAYGLVFIEALTYGLPCIARNEFEMKEFINHGENGYLIDEDNPEKLAILMKDLLVNETIKKNVIKNRDFYINEYSWDSVANRITSIINNNYEVE